MASIEELHEELLHQSSRRLEAEHERTRIDELWRGASRDLAIMKSRNKSLEDENAVLAQRVSSMENEIADLSSSLLDQANQQVAEANRKAAAAQKLVEERDDLIEFQQAELQALKEMLEREEQEKFNIKGARKMMRVTSFSPSLNGSSQLGDGSTPPPGSGPGVVSSPLAGSPAAFEQSSVSGSYFSNKNTNNNSGTSSASRSVAPSSSYTSRPDTGGFTEGLRIKAPSLVGELSRDLILDLDSYASPIRPFMRTDLREFKEFMELWGVERNVHPTMFAKLETPPWRRPRFVHRIIQEDIEPTLRLDRTPHMSWLSTRAFLNGVLDQTLALEPVSSKEMPWALRPSQPCLLCGESRGLDIYARSFWARPAPDADTIVLDLTCVIKTRLVCELVGFLRHVARRGPTSDIDAQMRAWRQCNSMREQLFWARTGGLFPETAEMLAALQSSAGDDFEFDTEEPLDTPPPAQSNVNLGAEVPSSSTTPGATTTTTQSDSKQHSGSALKSSENSQESQLDKSQADNNKKTPLIAAKDQTPEGTGSPVGVTKNAPPTESVTTPEIDELHIAIDPNEAAQEILNSDDESIFHDAEENTARKTEPPTEQIASISNGNKSHLN